MKKLRTQKFKTGVDTYGAYEFAKDNSNDPGAIKLRLWEVFSNYRIKKWKQELKELSEKNGISMEDVCEYIGIEPSGYPGFYKKLPKTRETYISIGMAFKLPVKTINRWLMKYGGKRKLYAKDILEDLAWIYLIQANHLDRESDVNYYEQFETCSELMNGIYSDMAANVITDSVDTATLNSRVSEIVYDCGHRALKRFVIDNRAAFDSAYEKPKAYLKSYVTNILRVKSEEEGRRITLNSIRGYLDDSMINYLTSNNPHYVPKSKKTHIALGLALGMTGQDLDKYLKMMGYAPLDAVLPEEGMLISSLTQWEETHTLHRRFKNLYIERLPEEALTGKEEVAAVKEMLQLRGDVKDIYEGAKESLPEGAGNARGGKFPYMYD